MLVHAVALELTILLSFWLCLAVWQRDGSTPGRMSFLGLCIGIMLWCLGSLLELREIAPEVVTDKIRWIGILTCAPLWLGVCAHAARHDLAHRVPWFPLILIVPCAGLYALLYSEQWAGLFVIVNEGRADTFGPLFWVFTAYANVLAVTGSGMLLAAAWRERHHSPWLRRVAIALAPAAPLVANALYLQSEMAHPAMTPVYCMLAGMAIRSELLAGTFLQVLPVSHHELIRQLPLAVVLTDRHGVVVGVNPAAERRLGVLEDHAVGRNLEAILLDAAEEVATEISPILARRQEVGQLVLIDPPSKLPARATTSVRRIRRGEG